MNFLSLKVGKTWSTLCNGFLGVHSNTVLRFIKSSHYQGLGPDEYVEK